jgi:hypothetical protein
MTPPQCSPSPPRTVANNPRPPKLPRRPVSATAGQAMFALGLLTFSIVKLGPIGILIGITVSACVLLTIVVVDDALVRLQLRKQTKESLLARPSVRRRIKGRPAAGILYIRSSGLEWSPRRLSTTAQPIHQDAKSLRNAFVARHWIFGSGLWVEETSAQWTRYTLHTRLKVVRHALNLMRGETEASDPRSLRC